MLKQAFYAGFCFALLCNGCMSNDMEGEWGDAKTKMQEASFDAWVEHGRYGEVLIEGKEITGERQERSLPGADRGSVIKTYIDPAVYEKMQNIDEEEEVEVVLSVRSKHRLSKLPRYDRSLSVDHNDNLEIAAKRKAIMSRDARARSAERRELRERIEHAGGGIVSEHAAGNALVCRLTRGMLEELLAEHAEIASVTASSYEKPVQLLKPVTKSRYVVDTIELGRLAQKSDQYVDNGYTGYGYRVGLLDTGVYADHTVLKSPDHIDIWKDCGWTVYANCNLYPVGLYAGRYDPGDAEYDGGHGTGIANILIGNANNGYAYRGVAMDAWLDSANIYIGTHHNVLYEPAALRGLNRLAPYDDVIVANFTFDQTDEGAVASAADDLYDQGVIMIAPVGNSPAAPAYSPANAHKVIGAGAYYADTGEDDVAAAGVPTDNRIKPDVAGPTEVIAARNTGPTDMQYTNGTLAAAGFMGGAALLLRDYYDTRNWSSDPGAVYAALITFGDKGGSDMGYPDGAGNLELGEVNNSVWLSGVKYLERNQESNISFTVAPNSCDLRAGIWWAEDKDDPHRTIFLHLDDTVTTKAYSTNIFSVFQKVVYPGSLSSGTWVVSLYSPGDNPSGLLKVHYLIHYRKNCS